MFFNFNHEKKTDRLNKLTNLNESRQLNRGRIDYNFEYSQKLFKELESELEANKSDLKNNNKLMNINQEGELLSSQLKDSFLRIKSFKDLFTFLDHSTNNTNCEDYIFDIIKNPGYSLFKIPKKSGGTRIIKAPSEGIKILQRKLNYVFNQIYKPKKSAHGFIVRKNIITNAANHKKRVSILNIDLKDFFPSINFSRVRGVFINPPFNFEQKVATLIATICCYEGSLPQGAPTSPIISNFICRRLDSKLTLLAKENNCNYSRYADDLSFSFPYLANSEFINKVRQIIKDENFIINEKKVRVTDKTKRLEVTGLVVNKKVNVRRRYIRELRSILHDMKINGVISASARFHKKHKYTNKYKWFKDPSYFLRCISGRIQFVGQVRGKNDEVYLRLHKQLKEIVQKNKKIIKIETNQTQNKSDHLREEFNKNLKHDPINFTKALKRFSRKKFNLKKLVHLPNPGEEFKLNEVISGAQKEYEEIRIYLPYQINHIYNTLFEYYKSIDTNTINHPIYNADFENKINELKKKYRFGNSGTDETNLHNFLTDYLEKHFKDRYNLDPEIKKFKCYTDVEQVLNGIRKLLDQIKKYESKVNLIIKYYKQGKGVLSKKILEIEDDLGSTYRLDDLIYGFKNFEGDISELRDKDSQSGHFYTRCDWEIESYFEEKKAGYKIILLNKERQDLSIPNPNKIKTEKGKLFFKHKLIFYDP